MGRCHVSYNSSYRQDDADANEEQLSLSNRKPKATTPLKFQHMSEWNSPSRAVHCKILGLFGHDHRCREALRGKPRLQDVNLRRLPEAFVNLDKNNIARWAKSAEGFSQTPFQGKPDELAALLEAQLTPEWDAVPLALLADLANFAAEMADPPLCKNFISVS